MPNTDRHMPGSFCWLELATTDQNAAKKFYGSLLGWTSSDRPMGPDEVYTMFAKNDRRVCGCYKLRMDMLAEGVPPHWMLYVCVAHADETVAKVKSAGGSVMCDPFSVFDFGRMTIFKDPSGAHLAIWQPKSHPGYGIVHEPGAFTWADLMTGNQSQAGKFYESVFGWKMNSGENQSGHLHIKNGDRVIGGIPPAGALPSNTPPHWMPYIMVESCDASTDKAKQLGAKLLLRPETMARVGRWSVIADPQGAVLSLFEKTH